MARSKTFGILFRWDARPWWRPFRPTFERFNCRYGVCWTLEWFGVIVWRDTSPETTCGDRGVW